MRFEFPDGKRKALTFSYDDGQIYDRQLVDIFNTYGLKSTFHLNSGNLSRSGVHDSFVTSAEIPTLYAGHEVAVHGVRHRNLTGLNRQQMVVELEEDRKALEKLTGYLVQGMSYAFGSYTQGVMDVARTLGIKYSRTVNSTHGFFPPADFLAWHPTCHHDDEQLDALGDRFLDIPDYEELPVFYVWGHSYEFGRKNDFSVIERFAKKMCDQDNIWYATNGEICDYILATRMQEFSADGLTIKNPTAITVWVSTKEGLLGIAPGEVRYLGEC